MLLSFGFSLRQTRRLPSDVLIGGAVETARRRNRDLRTEYEVLLMLDPDVPEERHDEIIERARALVERGDGTWNRHEPWGRRKLAYAINKKDEGVYHLLEFTCEPPTLDELSRVLKITDGVMRHMPVRRVASRPPRPVARASRDGQDAREPVPASVEEDS